MTWTEDRDCQLRQLWSAGHTAGQIAGVMKLSRNAIIGRARRMGLESRSAAIIPPRPSAKTIALFWSMEEFIAEKDLSVTAAARRVGMDPITATRMWEAMRENGGRQYQ